MGQNAGDMLSVDSHPTHWVNPAGQASRGGADLEEFHRLGDVAEPVRSESDDIDRQLLGDVGYAGSCEELAATGVASPRAARLTEPPSQSPWRAMAGPWCAPARGSGNPCISSQLRRTPVMVRSAASGVGLANMTASPMVLTNSPASPSH